MAEAKKLKEKEKEALKEPKEGSYSDHSEYLAEKERINK